jgi:hypothetical protein
MFPLSDSSIDWYTLILREKKDIDVLLSTTHGKLNLKFDKIVAILSN